MCVCINELSVRLVFRMQMQFPGIIDRWHWTLNTPSIAINIVSANAISSIIIIFAIGKHHHHHTPFGTFCQLLGDKHKHTARFVVVVFKGNRDSKNGTRIKYSQIRAYTFLASFLVCGLYFGGAETKSIIVFLANNFDEGAQGHNLICISILSKPTRNRNLRSLKLAAGN